MARKKINLDDNILNNDELNQLREEQAPKKKAKRRVPENHTALIFGNCGVDGVSYVGKDGIIIVRNEHVAALKDMGAVNE